MHVSKLIACLLGLCMTVASVPVALAAPPNADQPAAEKPIDTQALAMEKFTAGKAAYDAGKYEDALKLFLDAQSLYPSPVFHYNVGLCHEALGNLEQAVISYEAYLRSYQTFFGKPAEDQVNTQNKIDRLNKQIEAEKAAAEKPPEPEVVAPPPETEEEQPEKVGKPGRGMIIAGGVLTGVGIGAAVVGGSIYGAIAADVSGQLDNVYLGGNPERVTLEDARALDEKGRLAELNQILLLSLGGAIGVVGIALLAAGISKRNRAAASGAASQSAMVIPTAGPHSAGLVLQGRF